MGPIRTRRCAGSASTVVLLAILLGLIGLGAWNYRRNLAAEQARNATRPLIGYSDADLEALAEAYRQEVAQMGKRYEGARAGRTTAEDRGFFGSQIQEYERVRKASSAVRGLGAKLSEKEAGLAQVETELQARVGEGGSAWDVFLRRLLTF